MKPIMQLLACGLVLLRLTAAEPAKPPVFQIRLVEPKPTANSKRITMMAQDKEGNPIPVVLNVAKPVLMDISDVKSAKVEHDPINDRPEIRLTLTEHGQKALAELTRKNIDKQIAILVDGKVISAPVIRTEIRAGTVPVEGSFTHKEAEYHAERINKAVQEKQKGKMKP